MSCISFVVAASFVFSSLAYAQGGPLVPRASTPGTMEVQAGQSEGGNLRSVPVLRELSIGQVDVAEINIRDTEHGGRLVDLSILVSVRDVPPENAQVYHFVRTRKEGRRLVHYVTVFSATELTGSSMLSQDGLPQVRLELSAFFHGLQGHDVDSVEFVYEAGGWSRRRVSIVVFDADRNVVSGGASHGVACATFFEPK